MLRKSCRNNRQAGRRFSLRFHCCEFAAQRRRMGRGHIESYRVSSTSRDNQPDAISLLLSSPDATATPTPNHTVFDGPCARVTFRTAPMCTKIIGCAKVFFRVLSNRTSFSVQFQANNASQAVSFWANSLKWPKYSRVGLFGLEFALIMPLLEKLPAWQCLDVLTGQMSGMWLRHGRFVLARQAIR
jgi:hypothetical protein